MSRHRRAAPSISAAAPTAPRLSRLASNGPAWPGAPRTASPATGVPSSVTVTRRVAPSITCAGSSVSPAAPGSTRKSVSPSGVRAGTRSTSATWAHGTNRFVPESVQPVARFSARAWVASGRQSRSASRKASVARASPVAIADSQRFRCPSVPDSSIARAARTVGRYGPGTAARPISSRRIAVSTMPSPLPPCASGRERPSQPSSPISFHSVSLSPRGSSQSSRTVAGVMCSSRKARAEFFSNCWSELNAKFMASRLQTIGAHFLGQAEHAFADDVLLDLGGARVDGSLARPQERGRPRAGLARGRVDLLELLARRHELAPRPQDLERQLVVALLELRVRELGDRRRRAGGLAAVQRGEHAQPRVALDLELGVDLSQLGADAWVLDERPAVAPELFRGAHELVEGDRVARDAPEGVRAALEAERGLRDLPPLVQATDEIAPIGAGVGHEDLGEERGAGDLPERADLDARLAHVEEEARDALVLWRLRVGAGEQDPPVGDGPARGPDLLAVDDEVVALVLGARLEAREVRAGIGLGVELTPDLFGREHLLQVALLLPVGAVNDDRRPDEPDPESVDGGRRVDTRHLVLDDRLLHRRGSPAAQLSRPQHADVTRLVELPVPRLALVERLELVRGDVGREPATDLVPEREVFGGGSQIHRAASSLTDSPRLRLRLARPDSQTRLASGCGSHGHAMDVSSTRARVNQRERFTPAGAGGRSRYVGRGRRDGGGRRRRSPGRARRTRVPSFRRASGPGPASRGSRRRARRPGDAPRSRRGSTDRASRYGRGRGWPGRGRSPDGRSRARRDRARARPRPSRDTRRRAHRHTWRPECRGPRGHRGGRVSRRAARRAAAPPDRAPGSRAPASPPARSPSAWRTRPPLPSTRRAWRSRAARHAPRPPR